MGRGRVKRKLSVKKTISTELTPANIGKVIILLAEIPEKLASLSQRFPGEQLYQPMAPGERSFTEVVAHLLHCEARTSEAIYLALLTDEPLVADVHPERQWGKLVRYDLLECTDLLAYFSLRRTVLQRVLTSLTAAQWARTIREAGKQRQETVYWQARALALHELAHVSEIESWLKG